MMRQRVRVVGGVVLVASVLGVGACGPGTVPSGQPAVVVLTHQTLETVRQHFNEAAAQTRVVLLLSPT